MRKIASFSRILSFVLLALLLDSCSKTEKEYYPDGTIKSEVTMRGDKKNGLSTYYFENGNKELEMNYKDNQLDGVYEKFDIEGNRLESTEFVAGKKNGKTSTFYSNGKVATIAFFKNDVIDGEYFEYHPNGQLKVKGQYSAGLFDGDWEYYEAEGIRVGYAHFEKGNGQQVALHNGSQKKRIVVNFVKNEKNGEEIWFNRGGEIEKKILYKNGKIVNNETKSSSNEHN